MVKTIKEVREEAFVTLIGEVDGEGGAEYADNMTVSDPDPYWWQFEGAIGSRIEIAFSGKNLIF